MAERLSNLGYAMLKKETTKGTAVIPDIVLPMISDTFATDPHLDESKVIVGNKAARHRSYMGQRSHMGEIVMLAEPNTVGYLCAMALTKGTTAGAGPYTHPFTLSPTTNPNSYRLEILKGQVPYRFYGVESSRFGMSFDGNKGILTAQLHARGVFSVVEVASVDGAEIT